MASAVAEQNGHLENGQTSAAQKLMQKHEAKKPTIEEIPDEEDLKHGEPPHSASIIEDATDGDDAPAPTWNATMSANAAGKQKAPRETQKPSLDTQSQDHFPDLGGPKPKPSVTAPPTWGATKGTPSSTTNGQQQNGTTNGASTPKSGNGTPSVAASKPITLPGYSHERIVLEPHHILPRNMLKKPISETLKDINKKSKATITMSPTEKGWLAFNIVGPADDTRKAGTDLAAAIGSKQTIKVPVPRSARAHIIGKQGSTIKALQEKTGARIHMPKQDDAAGADDDEDAMVDVTVEGNTVVAATARNEILRIANERTPTLATKVRGIPAEFYPFINGKTTDIERDGVQVRVPSYYTWTKQPPPQEPAEGKAPEFLPAVEDNHILLEGDRSAVQNARAQIEKLAEQLRQQLSLKQLTSIPQNEHQFIIGNRGISLEDFFDQTGCAIILPPNKEDIDETITIVGPPDRLDFGFDRAMDLASTMHRDPFDISKLHRNARGGADVHASNVTRYLRQRQEIERLEKLHNTHIITPINRGVAAPWELYARERKNNTMAKQAITSIVGCHPPEKFANVDVDPFFYQYLQRDVTPRVRQDYGVHVIVPGANDNAHVVLVFEGPEGLESDYQVPSNKPSAQEISNFEARLNEARKHILDIISRQEQITTESIDVPKIFHDKLKRFILKEQKARAADQIPVRVSNTGTIVTLKGPDGAVKSLAAKVNEFVEQAKEDEKERGFTLSFDFPQKHANQLIGKGGSNIRELREKFDVEIQVDNGKVELKGPKAKSEAAKAHIISLGKQWADETKYTLKIEPAYHRELIGTGGSVINKLLDRYKVQIRFPHSRPAKDDQSNADAASEAGGRKGRSDQEPDEVVIRGPKKDADAARDELLSLLQYIKDTSFSATVTVQQSQIPSLIGSKGSEMDELRTTTGAKIDIPNARDAKDPSGKVDIQIKGTKSQVAQAKKILEEKKNVFDQIVSKTLDVDKEHHRALIGASGSNIRDIILKAGGSGDRRELARTVQFPKAEADGNTIKIEGNQAVVDKIIAAIQAQVTQANSQTTEVIEVPTDKHRSLIGRGGETKKDIESKFSVSIDIPRQGSDQTGIKIVGQPSDVEKAKAHILDLVKSQEGETVQVARNIHNIVADNGYFFRQLRNNYQVSVDHAGSKVPPKSAPSAPRTNGGALPLITDEEDPDAHSWNVVGNSSSDLEGEIPWILRGSPENIAKAKSSLLAAIEQAQRNTHTGYLILPDPRTYRYVIGQGGSKVNSIRKASGCKITVPKDQAKDEAIVVEGSEDGIEQARELILKAVKDGGAARS
ncbi:KH domain-containing protein [Phlyctema vagabunda]|uniref:KH domain-containing protein n=1 Tax=Phlyctema vagabunda TaxID=108571 RepID=A0ABR4PFR2_9HELO